ncbi:hypothetical protein BT93_D0791 [Corymbia citriodora subsp. variegata]|nr:hypothetical protein BT93_D0791 [Corymbia citriodora subsp. variegata]
MSCSCKKCTFLDPPSPKLACQICLPPSSPPPSAPSSSVNASCEICDTRASLWTTSSKRKRGDQVVGGGRDRVEVSRIGGAKDGSETVAAKGGMDGKSCPTMNSWKILSNNAWFGEDLEMHKRMKAIGELVQMHSPHVICFQVPHLRLLQTYDIFWLSSWWKLYHCSVSGDAANLTPYFCMLVIVMKTLHFGNSVMGRELCMVQVEVERKKPLTIAASHLESPCPAPPKGDQMHSKERLDQAKEAMDYLGKHPNVILRGKRSHGSSWQPSKCDFTWILRVGEKGWTYNTRSNSTLSANRTLQKCLDRFLYNLHDFKMTSIDMIGREAIAGLTYCREKKVRKELNNLVLPVLPSDHFSLLLTFGSK